MIEATPPGPLPLPSWCFIDGKFDNFILLLAFLALVGIVIYQAVSFHMEKVRLIRQNDELMNRLMSRDFTAYAAGSRALPANYKNIGEYAKAEKGEEKEKDDEPPADDGLGIPVT
jgi:hypothetical protein